jgi:DNA gyrase/topoisomerase IV subunit A
MPTKKVKATKSKAKATKSNGKATWSPFQILTSLSLKPVQDTLKRLTTEQDSDEMKLDKLEAKLDKAELKADMLEGKLDKLEPKADKLEAKLDKVEKKWDRIEAKLDKIEKKYDSLKPTPGLVEPLTLPPLPTASSNLTRLFSAVRVGLTSRRGRSEPDRTISISAEELIRTKRSTINWRHGWAKTYDGTRRFSTLWRPNSTRQSSSSIIRWSRERWRRGTDSGARAAARRARATRSAGRSVGRRRAEVAAGVRAA